MIADATTEAEYIVVSNAAKEVVLLKNFITNFRVVASISKPINVFCDNMGALAQSKEPRAHHRTRHILRKYHLIRKIVARRDIGFARYQQKKT